MMGVMEMMVMITIDAIISKHMVDIDKQDINLLLLDFIPHTFRRFGSIDIRNYILIDSETIIIRILQS